MTVGELIDELGYYNRSLEVAIEIDDEEKRVISASLSWSKLAGYGGKHIVLKPKQF